MTLRIRHKKQERKKAPSVIPLSTEWLTLVSWLIKRLRASPRLNFEGLFVSALLELSLPCIKQKALHNPQHLLSEPWIIKNAHSSEQHLCLHIPWNKSSACSLHPPANRDQDFYSLCWLSSNTSINESLPIFMHLCIQLHGYTDGCSVLVLLLNTPRCWWNYEICHLTIREEEECNLPTCTI